MEATAVSFQTDVIEASHSVPVLVDFWAEWCGPCRMLGPVLEILAEKADGKWQLVKMNVEEHPEIAQAYRIQGIPAVKLFSNGEVIAEFVGAQPEPTISKWLEEHLLPEQNQKLESAQEDFEAGEGDLARSDCSG